MKDLGKVVAHIPARASSKRVKAKNLRLLCGKPLLSYAVECAKASHCFDAIYVNSDSDDMLLLARNMGVKAYKRAPEFASDTATGDQFTADFITKIQPDTLVMINPVCPFITSRDVVAAIQAYQASDCDTLISCESTQMQTFCNEEPVNISLNGQLAPTQENPEVRILNWAVTVWDSAKFLKHYEETGSAYIGKQRLLFPIDPVKGIKISKESDFRLAELMMHGLRSVEKDNISNEYWASQPQTS